jgi:hypothetical protein
VDGTLTVSVADAPLFGRSSSLLTGWPGEELTTTVADFLDLAPDAAVNGGPLPVEDYEATIDWGDGTQSPGTVQPPASAGQPYQVLGSHSYVSSGYYPVEVLIHDRGGSATVVVDSSAFIGGTATTPDYPAFASLRDNDPERRDLTTAGDVSLAANTGSLRLSQPLDFDLSPGTSVGGNPALVYNSDSAGAHPVLQVDVYVPPPFRLAQFTATLIWEGQQQAPLSYGVAGLSANGHYLLQVPLVFPIITSGLYDYQVHVDISDGQGGHLQADDLYDPAVAVAAQVNSPLGAGWGLAGMSRLVLDPSGAVLRVLGSGDARLFRPDPAASDGSLINPEDYGLGLLAARPRAGRAGGDPDAQR